MAAGADGYFAVRVFATRDSVCAGDDVSAPNRREFVFSTCSIRLIVDEIARSDYLARIVGGKATWIARSTRPLAVIAQQWSSPGFVGPDSCDGLDLRGDGLRIHFDYAGQDEPDVVFQRITEGLAGVG